MRKLLTVLPVAALAFYAGCQDQPTSLRHPSQVASPDAPELARVTGASFTTVDSDSAGCRNGTGQINCNLYTSKGKVYLSGGPIAATFFNKGETRGRFIFTVLVPGFQNDGVEGDGKPGNLSDNIKSQDQKNGTNLNDGSGDPMACRIFDVDASGTITYPVAGVTDCSGAPGAKFHHVGKHPGDGKGIIRLMPYDNTTNPGGVYILAVCQLKPNNQPDDCKYDAFKVFEGSGPPKLDAIISIEETATNGITEPHTFTITATALGGTPNESASPNYHFTISTTLKQVKDGVEVDPVPDPTTGNTCSNPTVENAVTVSCTLTINSSTAATFKAYAEVTVKDYGTTQLTATAATNGENGNSGPATKTYLDAGLRWEKVDDSHPAKHIGGAVFTIERTMDRFGNELNPSDPIITDIEDCVEAPCTGYDKNPAAGSFRVDGLQFGTWKITETKAPDGYRMADPASQSVITDLNKPIGKLANAFVNPKIPPLVATVSIEKDAKNGITEPHTFTIKATASGGTPNPDASASLKYTFAVSTSVSPEPSSKSTTCSQLTVVSPTEVSCTLTINSNQVGEFVANTSVTVKDYGTPQQTAEATTEGKTGVWGPATKKYVDAELRWEKVGDSNPAKHLAGAIFKIERIKDRLDPNKTLSPPSPIITNITDCTAAPCMGPDKDERAGYFRVENLPFGTWKITETQAPAGYNLANPAYQTVDVTNLEEPTNKVTLTFVNPGKYSSETATGGGYPWNVTKNSPENWFMYSPWASEDFTALAKLAGGPFYGIGLIEGNVPLIAGQQYLAGTIKGEKVSDTQRKITITLANGFRFASGSGSVKVLPMKACTPAKNITYVQPGGFDIKTAGNNKVDPRSAEVLVPSKIGNDPVVCYGIHVDVERPLFPI
jgi:hypothetical protein